MKNEDWIRNITTPTFNIFVLFFVSTNLFNNLSPFLFTSPFPIPYTLFLSSSFFNENLF
jgi:hypothetical protein